ncbi:MAG: ComF family protein [Cytophaga sp.]|uniref:ComF family protein n=1 Tax=Cytophaga sp. TaxID=29535 RepID=UPI003F7FE0AC
MKNLFKSIGSFSACLSDVLYPPHCIVCESGLKQGETDVCAACLSTLPLVNEDYSPESLYIRLSIELRPSFVWAFLSFDARNKTQKILHAIKYGDSPDIATRIAAIWADRIKASLLEANIDVIIPIPLHQSKMRKRGYNQATKIAQGFTTVLESCPVEEQVLYRKRNLFIQAKSTRAKRFQNVKEVYAIKNIDRIQGKHVLLIDDVLTTGATLEACGVLLKKAGAAKVSVGLLAMVVD